MLVETQNRALRICTIRCLSNSVDSEIPILPVEETHIQSTPIQSVLSPLKGDPMELTQWRRQTFVLSLLVTALSIANGRARADEQAEKLIREVTTRSASLKSMTGVASITATTGGQKEVLSGAFRLMKPNKAFVEMKGASPLTVSSNGVETILLMPGNQYTKMTPGPKGEGIPTSVLQVSLFFDPARFFSGLKTYKRSYGGKEKMGGLDYDLLLFSNDAAKLTFYVGPDKVIKRVKAYSEMQKAAFVSEISNVRLNPSLTKAAFAYTLPRNAKLMETPNYDAKLVAVGEFAEKFDLARLDQDHLTFDDAAKGKKAVLVNFWFYG